ncbi:MAG: hypothetical protein QF415_16365 [Candidatus Undinarchaeales archaeon]|jgi:hypothetical protein|nr:hypothetical protein [Candidatus Undinarchaeales archaeon]MDP7494432.1 hypothetical protein [Candidatus Undinarchaeales archaeon]
MSKDVDEKGMLELLGDLVDASLGIVWASLELAYAFVVVFANVTGLLPGTADTTETFSLGKKATVHVNDFSPDRVADMAPVLCEVEDQLKRLCSSGPVDVTVSIEVDGGDVPVCIEDSVPSDSWSLSHT